MERVSDRRGPSLIAAPGRPSAYKEFADPGNDPACTDVIARLQAALFDWALHPKMHITTLNAKIAVYADDQMQVKGGILIGIWDETELAAIRARVTSASPSITDILGHAQHV
jgi:hypothetical protein